MTDALTGIPVVVSRIATERHAHRPARPHRRRRIARKWLKRFGLKTTVAIVGPFMVGGSLVVHPSHVAALKSGGGHGG